MLWATRPWALIKFLDLESGRLFEVGANSRLGAYSNKYGSCTLMLITKQLLLKLDMLSLKYSSNFTKFLSNFFNFEQLLGNFLTYFLAAF